MKAIKRVNPKTPKTRASKPVKLSKSDPEYYRKIGLISAAKRKMTSKDFSKMAKKSHGPESRRNGEYHGGRKPKDGAAVAES